MRSSKIDECFNDPEEQEFLSELVEQALGEAHETLAAHNADILDGGKDFDSVDRQERKIKFLEELHEYLE